MKHIKHYRVFEASAALTPEQIKWLNKCTSGTWKLNPQTGLVDVDGDFNCFEQGLSDFKGVRFGVVKGSFWCYNNRLTSLEGAPREVGVSFDCDNNRLTSLVGAPQKVGGDFYCGNNLLTILVGAPREVGRSFYCGHNLLTSLVGAPREVGEHFACGHNLLTSLEGAPEKVRGSFSCGNNQLTSLVGAPREVGEHFACEENRLTSLEGAPRDAKYFSCDDNPVSLKTLQSIFSRMKGGESYLKAVESLWAEIPLEDQVLLYRPEFKWVGAEEAKKLQAVGRFNKIKGML